MKNLKFWLTVILFIGVFEVKAVTYFVDTEMDLPDDDLLDGVCDTGLSGNTPICSLRAAVMQANHSVGVDDIIALPNNLGDYKFTRFEEDDDAFKGDLDVTDNLSIINATQAGATIDAKYRDRIFHVHNGVTLSLQGLNLINGVADSETTFEGGAILVDNGTLITERVTFSNNIATTGGAIRGINANLDISENYFNNNANSDREFGANRGSAIYAINSQINIDKTTFALNVEPSNNSMSIPIDTSTSAVHAIGDLTELLIQNSTLTNNHTGINTNDIQLLDLIHTTVANNSSEGLRFISGDTLIIEKSLIANNGTDCLVGLVLTEMILNNNGSSDSSCQFDSGNNLENLSQTVQSVVGDWGGYAPTLMLQGNSPAIDAAGICNNDYLVDQRESARPVDGNNDFFALCDMGALEFNPSTDDVIFQNGFD